MTEETTLVGAAKTKNATTFSTTTKTTTSGRTARLAFFLSFLVPELKGSRDDAAKKRAQLDPPKRGVRKVK